jgi:hypothetical protein
VCDQYDGTHTIGGRTPEATSTRYVVDEHTHWPDLPHVLVRVFKEQILWAAATRCPSSETTLHQDVWDLSTREAVPAATFAVIYIACEIHQFKPQLIYEIKTDFFA